MTEASPEARKTRLRACIGLVYWRRPDYVGLTSKLLQSLTQETRMPSVWHLANQLAPVLRSGVIEDAAVLHVSRSYLAFVTVSVPPPLLAFHLLTR